MFANFTSFVASFILGSFIVSFFFKNWEIFGFTHQKYKIFRRRKDTLSTDHVAQKGFTWAPGPEIMLCQ